jgi:Fe2+ transport system protein FeoA
MEMGVYVGGVVTVQKNDPAEPNIVIGVGDSRYIIPRTLASRILIK